MKTFFSDISLQASRLFQPSPVQPATHDPTATHQMLLTPPPRWSRTLIWSLGLGSLALLSWSCLSRIEETSNLPGQLETIRAEASIKSPDAAVVERVNAVQHQLVRRGQVLFTLSRADLKPRLESIPLKLELLKQKGQRDDLAFAIRLSQAKARIQLNTGLVARLRGLVQQGSAQEVQLLDKENELFQSKAEHQALLEEKAKLDLQRRIEINDLSMQLRELRARSAQFDVVSPIGGSLQQLAVQVTGQRVDEGEVLAKVLPNDGLIASVQVSSKLAAPIRQGKPAEITVDAFPANEHGTLRGVVESVSPTTAAVDSKGQAQAYIARIRIASSGIPKEYPAESLRSGMGITARVVLHEKPVIAVVFDFLEDIFKPMTERR